MDVRDWSECTPLHHAARKGAYETIKTLLELKANIYAVDLQKMTALHHAAVGSIIFI